ncbi:pyridoxamine 5'-phosphate oxidase family protein [Terrabacter sp. LjRoot27]|uniref:pyridoxamine 5'-phosphate oxidase family protein n=1 Tax=Terrabacter sp. LjRoot27 TaxID=3342306 RepID=UPI003ECC4B15
MSVPPSELPEGVVDRVRIAATLLGDIQYMTLATADESGRPWASTVWFCASLRSPSTERLDVELIWLSRPEAQHSANLLERPEVGISVFDSRQPADTGVGLQLAARAEQVPAEELEAALAAFSTASVAAGGNEWSLRQVQEPAPLRVYRAHLDRALLLVDGSRAELPLS